MNQAQSNKTSVYIIIAIILIVVLAAFIYTVLSLHSGTSTVAESDQTQNVTLRMLTPEESAEKTATIEDVNNQKPITLTPAQAAAKAAIISKIEAGEK